MTIPLYQVDAFASGLFTGNPAAVCLLNTWLDDDLLQKIAAENNLSETAFLVMEDDGYRIRWFTPCNEVDLCGHATLATAHVLFTEMGLSEQELKFNSRKGVLKVRRDGEQITLVFPADVCEETDPPAGLLDALGVSSEEVYKGATDYMVVLENETQLASLSPDFKALKKLGVRGVIVTSPSATFDFVSRFFAPGVGIDEDPVTGSAHTTLTPYWSKRLAKTTLNARQISQRGGLLTCSYSGDNVELSGKAVTFLRGEIDLSSAAV